MNRFQIFRACSIALLLSILFCRSSVAAAPGDEMAWAASNFLSALTPEQRAKATFALTDEERFDWHFIPKARKGLPFKEMTAAQQKLAHALLSSGLSQRGYTKATTIMSLDQILADMEQGKGPKRDSDLYYFTVFGEPTSSAPWGWRVEGHHLSLNFVVRGGEVLAETPAFFGSNPAEVRSGPRTGLRVLGVEDDLGRHVIKSLTENQRRLAVITNVAPNEIITGNSRKAQLLDPPGISVAEFTTAEKELLMSLVREYAFRHRAELADQDLAKIAQTGWDKLRFAWAGGLEPGQGHYYRIQGPTFLIEFDNTQNDANHIHTVWRDFENDFGEDVLRKHYQEAHQK